MSIILCISPERENPLPPLEVLGHQIHIVDFDPQSLAEAPRHDIAILDCRTNLVGARSVARILLAAGWQKPLLMVVSEAGLPAVSVEWGARDFILDQASLAEVDARLRMFENFKPRISSGDVTSGLTIDVATFTAKINGVTLDLTYKEFELLRYLTSTRGRCFLASNS